MDDPTELSRTHTPGSTSPFQPALLPRLLARLGARVQRRRSLGVFELIGQAPRLFFPWLGYSAAMMPWGYLSRQDTELVILRVAYLRGSDYELDQHRDIARRVGVEPRLIDAVCSASHGQQGRRGLLLTVADELVGHKRLTSKTKAQLSTQLSRREQVALVMLVNQYDGLATALDVFEVPVDERR